MSFQEKSAYIMGAVLLFFGGVYFYKVLQNSSSILELASPNLPELLKFTVFLIFWSIVAHIAIAITSPNDANEDLDEREKQIFDKAGHFSGLILGIGIIFGLGHFLFTGQANALFYICFASLMLSQLTEYGVRIFLYRSVL